MGFRDSGARRRIRASDRLHENARRRALFLFRRVRTLVPRAPSASRGVENTLSGCAVFLSVNFDAEAYDLKSTSEDRLFGRFSYGRYGVRAGLPRLIGMLARSGIAATTFVTASDALRHPDAIRALRDAGHEIASRGLDLAPVKDLGGGERDALLRARDTLAKITGAAPTGYRAPGGELGPRTLPLLAELGYTYDSSFQDDDH